MELNSAVLTFINQNGISTAMLIFAAWFLVGKLWPWYTSRYLPELIARQDQRDKVLSELRDAIVELKTLTAQLVAAVQHHDDQTRDLVLTLGSNQQAILELLRDQDELDVAEEEIAAPAA